MLKNLIQRVRGVYTGWKSTWLNRWRVRGWPDRIGMLVPILAGVFLAVLSAGVAFWIAMWFFFGPPSVNIAGVMVDLDRSLSLAGPDKDANGIRDDIDSYIKVLAEKKGYDGPQVKAMQQGARAMQGLVTVDILDKKAIDTAHDADLLASSCIFNLLGDNDGYAINRSMERMVANTKQRALAYIKYNHTQDGNVTMLPQKDTCEK